MPPSSPTDTNTSPAAGPHRAWVWLARGVVLASAVVAVEYAKPFAGSYSDGSRLAAIESLGGRGTFSIDESRFVGLQVNEDGSLREDRPPAYDPEHMGGRTSHLTWGTQDRMLVHGRFYSHHPPVPLALGAGLYRVSLVFGGPRAEDRTDLFVRWITIATAGLPFVVGVWAVARIARLLNLSGFACVLLPLGFGFATLAGAYSRQVNAHIMLLGVGSVACLLVARAEAAGAATWRNRLALGTMAGAGYCLDGAIGPALVLCTFAYCAATGWRGLVVAAVAALPWVVAHHALLYALFDDPMSPASNPNNWNWPHSPFNPNELTGVKIRHTPFDAVAYGWEMTFGPRGFLRHNIPLLLALPAVWVVARHVPRDRRAVAFAAGWVVIGTLPYLLSSNNLAGTCLSVRWFVPFLAPGFYLIALLLKYRPRLVPHLAWLTACGLYFGVPMLKKGPWELDALPRPNVVFTVALVGWGCIGVAQSGAPGREERT